MMTNTKSLTIAAVLSLGVPALAPAVEDLVEHETYKKQPIRIETGPAVVPTTTTLAPSRVYEHHDESESTTVERRTVPPPAPVVVKERITDSVETKEAN